MRTIAIGDIHGCRASLEAMVDYAGLADDDRIVALGDYVDRGPDSKGVIDDLLTLRERIEVVALLGNHEIMMLAARRSRGDLLSWVSPGVGGEATLNSYGAKEFKDIPAAHWKFIENCLPYYEIDTHFFVHAGVAPDRPLDKQDEFALYWKRFDKPEPHMSGKVMICGHTSQKEGLPVNLGHAICIDTWACGEGWLTALDVKSGRYWQTNEGGQRRSGDIGEFRRSC